MNYLAIALLLMLIMVVTELAYIQWVKRQAAPWADMVFNLNSGHVLLWLSLGIVVVVFGLGLWRGEPLFEMFLTAVSLAVAAIPELMELNIGHFLIGEAIFVGLGPAIRRMRDMMDVARKVDTQEIEA